MAETEPGTDQKTPERLSGHMNTFKLVLTVLAFSSPLTTMAGYFSLTIGVLGETAPVAFVVITGALLVFTVGYMAMTRRMRRTGAYYAYITTGLGRPLGLGSAYGAVVAYLAVVIGVYAFVGLVVQGLVTRFGGPEIPWWVGAFVAMAIVGILAYFNIDVSVRVFVWVMVLEIAIVLIFDLAVLFQGGAEGISVASFNVVEFAGAEMWVGFLFAILVFIGFEATVLYRDETRNPDRTVPRATYISVLLIGGLYTFSVWMLATAFGANAQQVANENLAEMFSTGAATFVGVWFSDVVTVLLITAVLAALLSIHNAATRYIFNMGTDGGFPKAIGAVHPKYRSPYRASLVASAVSLVVILIVAISGGDPGVFYATLAGVGSVLIIILMILVCVAVVVWFRRNPKLAGENVWKTLIAPVLAGVFLLVLTIYAVINFELVVGGNPGDGDWLLIFVFLPFVVGLIVAPILKARNAARYASLGGREGAPDEDQARVSS